VTPTCANTLGVVSSVAPCVTAPKNTSVVVTAEQRVLEQLKAVTVLMTATALRQLCHIRNATLQTALAEFVADGQLRKDRAGYVLVR
jgi:hypothetical protein